MMYAIFSGYDSDWNILGYFENKDDAEKYVASYNDVIGDDEYYILEVNSLKLTEEQKNIKVKQYHSVVFDYKNRKFTMRNEHDRYEPCLKDKERMIQINYSYKWVAFNFVSEDREDAERICQDLTSQIERHSPEWKDVGEIIKSLCFDWNLYEFDLFNGILKYSKI